MSTFAPESPTPRYTAAEIRMWELVEQYTNKVGYQRGAKASSLNNAPPVIDCSGWVAFLITEAMKAHNKISGKTIFDINVIDIINPWSDQIIAQIIDHTEVLLEGHDITTSKLPRNATIGLNEGYFDWQENHPRPRGINHIAQIVRRPSDQSPFVSESYSINPGGIRLTPLKDWLDSHADVIADNRAWVVDPFAMIDPI